MGRLLQRGVMACLTCLFLMLVLAPQGHPATQIAIFTASDYGFSGPTAFLPG